MPRLDGALGRLNRIVEAARQHDRGLRLARIGALRRARALDPQPARVGAEAEQEHHLREDADPLEDVVGAALVALRRQPIVSSLGSRSRGCRARR